MANKNILIADQDKAIALALCNKLQHEGFNVATVYDGSEVLRTVEKTAFDLIILELILPTQDGFSVLEKLRSDKNTTPIIIFTVLGEQDDYERVLSLAQPLQYFVKNDAPLADVVNFVGAFFAQKKVGTSDAQETAIAHVRSPITPIDLNLKQQEVKSLQKGFELLADHLIITDANANIIYANPAAEKNTGFKVQEMIGKNPGDLWGGKMPKSFYSKMWKTIKYDKKPFVGAVKNLNKNGHEYWQEIHITPILDLNGDIKFFIGIEPNITERKMKDTFTENFTSLLAQQLQNPLDAIRWVLEWLVKAENLTTVQQQMLNDAYMHHKSLVHLVTDLLVMTEIRNENVEEIDLIEIVREIAATLQRNHNKIAFVLELAEDKFIVPAQKSLLKQLFFNIMMNAVDYAAQVSPQVTVRLEKSGSQNGAFYIFSCKDNGIGIPPLEQEHIFKKFFRGSNAREIKKDGAGLGLFIAKMIAEKYGYDIDFKSVLGKGSTFTIKIPLS